MKPLALVLLTALPLAAHSPPPIEVRAVRAERAPVIDGRLDEEVWRHAPEITGLVQRDPHEGEPATERTVIRILYDEAGLYVGAMLHDSHPPDVRLGRRDSTMETDWFGVLLDPYHDHRSGAGFWVSASGVQADQALFDDVASDWDWDAVWASATIRLPDGWSVEMAIPWSQLRFSGGERQTWGVNFIRKILRNREEDRLAHTPKNESGSVSRFAHLGGIEGIRHRRALELLPYGVARAETGSAPGNRGTRGNAGLDLKYALGSNLTLTGTINPDFGQVELDPAVLNLTQFETFYPERRPFFVEGAGLFEFGRAAIDLGIPIGPPRPRFFYSRRVGRAPQGPALIEDDLLDPPRETTILGAAKLTGKTAGGWSLGLLDAVTDQERSLLRSEEGESRVVEPMTNYFAGRAARDLGDRGRLGVLVTNTRRNLPAELDRLRDDAWTAGVDGYWWFGDREVVVEGYLAASRVSGSTAAIAETQTAPAHGYHRPDASHIELDPARTSLSGTAGRLAVEKKSGTWRYVGTVESFSPGFELNDSGFLQRADYVSTFGILLYTDPTVTRRFRQRDLAAGRYRHWNHAGDIVLDGGFAGAEWTHTNYLRGFFYAGAEAEALDDRATRGGPLLQTSPLLVAVLGGGTDQRRRVVAATEQFHARRSDGSFQHQMAFSITWNPAPHLTLAVSPVFDRSRNRSQYVETIPDPAATATYGSRYVFATIDQRTFALGTRLEWTRSPRFAVQLYLQPFIAAGDYEGFKDLAAPRTRRFVPAAGAPGDHDFNFRSLRGNAVVRWEFRRGSALYVVWSENREGVEGIGDFRLRRDLSALGRVPSDEVFLIKVSYWLDR
ncbi:MAG TPA: DUF5916 domain-containing protein [Thermoanaerobaculia bacterium]|nr:DUF5916 domain-containing protein [Thermoanaerobaculia bacterium]